MMILFLHNTDQHTLNCVCASGNWSKDAIAQVPELCKILAERLALTIVYNSASKMYLR